MMRLSSLSRSRHQRILRQLGGHDNTRVKDAAAGAGVHAEPPTLTLSDVRCGVGKERRAQEDVKYVGRSML